MTAAAPALADWHYPLLNIFWTMLWFFLWIVWIFVLVRILIDVFRSDDLSGVAKAAWTIFLIVLPFLAALIYLLARGSGMHERDARQAAAQDRAMRSYIQTAAGSAPSKADELQKLADLRDRGVLSASEFEAQKAKILT